MTGSSSGGQAGRGPGVGMLLVLAALGGIIAPLNSTMIAVALPDIRSEFHLSHAAAGWLISSYLIAMAIVQPLGGRIGDQAGRVRVLRWGLAGCLACSIGAMVALNFTMLVAFRTAQAIFAAALIPNGVALFRTAAPPDQLGRLNGINGAVLSAAAAAGPLLGAAALAMGSWRVIFVLNLPLVAANLALLRQINLEEVKDPRRSGIDWAGIGLFIALLVGITFQLSNLRDTGLGPRTWAGWGVVAFVAAAFVMRQRTTTRPAAEWRLFASRSFTGATIWILCTNLTMYTTLLMIPFFIDDVQGKSVQLSGLLLGAMSVLVAAASPVGGRLSDRYGRRLLMVAGAAIAFSGAIGLMMALRADTPAWLLASCLAALGVGLGLGTGPAVSAALEAAPVRLAGAASGTSSMMRYMGSIAGAGVLAGVLSNGSNIAADIGTFRIVTSVIVVTAGVACLAAFTVHRFDATVPEAVEPRADTLPVGGR